MSAPVEIEIAFADIAALAAALADPEARKLVPGAAALGGSTPRPGDLVSLVVRIADRQQAFRAHARVEGSGPALGFALLPEEDHVRELLAAAARGESVPYAHRYGRRRRTQLTVEYDGPGGTTVSGQTRDVGEGGLSVLCPTPAPAGSELTLRIHGGGAGAVVVRGRVVGSRGGPPEPYMSIELRFASREEARAYRTWFERVDG